MALTDRRAFNLFILQLTGLMVIQGFRLPCERLAKRQRCVTSPMYFSTEVQAARIRRDVGARGTEAFHMGESSALAAEDGVLSELHESVFEGAAHKPPPPSTRLHLLPSGTHFHTSALHSSGCLGSCRSSHPRSACVHALFMCMCCEWRPSSREGPQPCGEPDGQMTAIQPRL